MTDARRQQLFALGAVGAGLVALVFAFIGDGVEVPSATGLRRVVVDYGHTAVWVLLAAALAIAAVNGRWTRLAGGLAIAALVTYGIFLAAVFLPG